MPNGLELIERLWVTEDWELARQVLLEAEELRNSRNEIEDEFGIDLEDLESVIDLPDASLRKLKERILTRVDEQVRGYNDALYQKVCVEWDYCNRKNTGKAELAEYLAALLDIVVTGGALALAALLLKRGYFDRLCQCSK